MMFSGKTFTRITWTIWALIPILALSYHYGPGQLAYNEDLASGVIAHAEQLQADAMSAHEAAYEAHVAAISARAAAFGNDDPALKEAAENATLAEAEADTVASEKWQQTADALGEAQALIHASDLELRNEVRLARARALVRAGDIGTGADDLEALLDSLAETGDGDSPIGLEAREELATAYYFGARLLRLEGAPGEHWREVSARARQNFRYLADRAREKSASGETITNHEKNGELVLNLEQSALNELYAKPRPRSSPPAAGRRLSEKRPCRGKSRKQGDEPSNGAGINGEIGPGW